MRQVNENDIEAVSEIFKNAKQSIRDMGVRQWHNEYPNKQTVKDDIISGIGYVLEQDGLIAAYVAITTTEEYDYGFLYDGEWLTRGESYATIHRIAVSNVFRGKGFSKRVFQNAEQISKEKGCRSIRVDTHPDNHIMRGLVTGSGYKYCGIIYLRTGDEAGDIRYCYEKIIN